MNPPNLKYQHSIALWLYFILILFYCCETESNIENNSSFNYTFENLEESPIEQNQQFNDWESTGWGVYEDIIFDGTTILHNTEHDDTSFDSRTLVAEITGGDRYNNAFFTNTIAKRWEQLDWFFRDVKQFEFLIEFYPETAINCDISDLSEVEGFEFTFQNVVIPNSWGWGLQWSKTNTWSYRNDQKINNEIVGWENINGLSSCIQTNQWNSLKMTGVINGNSLTYETLEFNSEVFDLNITLDNVEVPTGWSENFLQIGFQINGNDAIRTDHSHGVDPVKVYLNNINLKVTD